MGFRRGFKTEANALATEVRGELELAMTDALNPHALADLLEIPIVVHNDAHAHTRQHSNLAHELAHALLLHPPTQALDNVGCRHWDQDVEDEASWLGGVLLVPEPAAMAIAKGRWTAIAAAEHFDVSPAMIRFRLNATGAVRRVQRSRKAMSGRTVG